MCYKLYKSAQYEYKNNNIKMVSSENKNQLVAIGATLALIGGAVFHFFANKETNEI